MKGTEHFKIAIDSYLRYIAQNDEEFEQKLSNPQKNIDDCITYIFNQVKASGCNGFIDDEIYGMAIHYYDEENINIGSSIKCGVVVNHIVELTEEEKDQAKQTAINSLIREEKEKQLKKKTPQKEIGQIQNSLFD